MNTRLVAFAVAILLALVGQSFWTRDANLLDGTLLMVLAAAISLWAVGGTRSSEGQPEPVSPAPIRPRGRLYQGVLAVALALFTSGGMVLYIWGTRGAYQAGFLWVISLFLLFFGLYHMEGWPRPHLSRRTLWREGVPLAAILALAAFLRFYRLDTAPPGSLSDEGLVAGMVTLLARGLEGPIHSPFETAWIHVNLPYYPMALAFKLMGSTILASRTVSALVGLGSVAAFYFLARHMFGVTPALGATLLLAMSRWHFHMSRLGWENVIHVVLFETLAFLFLLRGLRSGRPTEYAWAGASTALTVYMYHSGKLLLLMMGVFLLYLLVVERRALYPALRWGLAAYLLGAVMAFAPLGTVIAKDPNRYISHVTEVSLWRQAANNGQDLGVLIRDNALAAVQIFNHRGDLAVRHNIPGAPAFDTLTAALFFLGLVWGVRQARTREGFLLLSWLAIALSAAVMSDNNASMSRAMGAIPPAFLLVAGYARRIQQALPSGAGQGLPLAPAWTRQAVGVGAVAFFGISGLLNYDAYFNQYVKRDDTWREFQNIEWGAARAINQLSWDNDVLVGFEFVDSQVVRYAVVPQIVPPFTAFTIYRWDINVRSSTIIGFVGGGGIGFYLVQWIQINDMRAVGAAFIAIAVVVVALDYISAKIRERLA